MQHSSRLCAAPQSTRVSLRLMATSDLHVHVLAYDYYADKPSEHVGLERTAALIAQARQENPDALLFDNGDFLQGNPLGDFVAHNIESADDSIHPVFAAMNQLNYQAATLGNHEFNYGIDFLSQALRGANFPVVSANIALDQAAVADQDSTFLPPFTLLDRQLPDANGVLHAIRIGVIGFAPPQIVQWDRLHLEGRLTARGIVEAAAEWVPRMKAAGADVIVALAHAGIGPADAPDDSENAATRLATVSGIDAIICGHSHLVFPAADFAQSEGVDPIRGALMGKPAVMPGFYGSHLGVIDLTLDQTPEGWTVTDFRCEARPIFGSDRGTPKAVAQSVDAAHQATLAFTRRTVGRNTEALHSYFAPLTAQNATRVIAEAQAAFVARALRGRPEEGLPILSAAAPFKAGGRGGPNNYTSMPAGDLALRNIADLYIFPNTIAALRVTGTQLREWLENAVGIFVQIRPGVADQMLLDRDFPCYNFDMIFGLDMDIDLAQPPRYDRHGIMKNPQARRIKDLRLKGQPLDLETEYILATNSYRASGCGAFAGSVEAQTVDVGRTAIRDLLLTHVAAQSPLHLPRGPDWHFSLPPASSVIFQTSPAAGEYIDEIAHLSPEYVGQQVGFSCFRLTQREPARQSARDGVNRPS